MHTKTERESKKQKHRRHFIFPLFFLHFFHCIDAPDAAVLRREKKEKRAKKSKTKGSEKEKEKGKTLLSFSRAKGKTRRKSRHHFLVEMAGPPLKRAISTTFKVKETIGKSGGLCAVWLARLPKQKKKGNQEMKIYYGTFRNHGINKRKGCCKERDAGKIR